MNVCRISHSFALLAVIAVASSPVAGKPLPTDSRIRTGKLGNGLTWMYRKHDNPPGKMAFNLHVRSGSLNETDAQQGLAHFLEHMCFNGTDNFPPGKLIPYFEGIGMQFGQHLNAFTSFDQTVYMLFTPTTDVDRVDEALMVLSDYAFRCLLLEEEIDKERGVVLEESRTGKGPFERLRNQVWPRLFPGTRFANRLPIGKEEIVENATRQDFVDYYRTWYRPENMTLGMVGDAEPDAFLPIIDKWFGQYKPAVPARPQEIAGFKPFTERRAIVATDPEMQWASLQMTRIDEGRPPTTDFSQARTELVEGIGSWLVGRRFDDQIQKGNASYLFAGASVSSFFNDGMIVDGSTRGEPGQWEDMLQQLIVEIKRAREHGFTEREIEMAKKEFIATAERGVKTEPSRNARGIVGAIVRNVNSREPSMSAQQELDTLNEILPSISADDVSRTFAKHFKPGVFTYVLQMPDREELAVPSEADVLAAAKRAWAVDVAPLESDESPTTLLAQMPTAGKVVESSKDDELGITSAWLSNGVRVHHRYMDYKKDSVWVTIALAGGEIEESADTAGVTMVASLAVNDGGTSRLTSTNIRDIMTGVNIGVSASAGGDAFTIRVAGSPDDLELGLQRAHAALVDGKIEKSAFDTWRQGMLQQLEMMETMPPVQAQIAMADLLSGGDPR
ncbi:MAG: insulinase family protein [Phycisphaerae bacterium]